MITKLRKKPIIVEAMFFDGTLESAKAIVEWAKGKVHPNLQMLNAEPSSFTGTLICETLEGTLTVPKDHYIICGVKNEYYPCAKDVADMSYDIV